MGTHQENPTTATLLAYKEAVSESLQAVNETLEVVRCRKMRFAP